MKVSVPRSIELKHRIPDRLDWYTLRSLFNVVGGVPCWMFTGALLPVRAIR